MNTGDASRTSRNRTHGDGERSGGPSARHTHQAAGDSDTARRTSRRSRTTHTEVFVISVAAELAGMHAQTLRTYDRMGLVTPQRTRGGGRRYSRADIDQLREIQRLSHDEGVNLAGIKAIIDLQNEVERLRDQHADVCAELLETRQQLQATQEQLHAARSSSTSRRSRGEIVHVPRSTAVVMWEPRRGRGRREDVSSQTGRRSRSASTDEVR